MYLNKTLKELLNDPVISKIAPDAIRNWDLSKEEFYDWTLQEIADKMGWKNLNNGFMTLFEAAKGGNYYFELYTEEECRECPERENTNIVYLPSKDPEADNRPFIMIVPGGGFNNVWSLTEGWPIARIFNRLGYHAFVLTYCVDTESAAVKAMGDMARAMEIIKEKKDGFHVDPKRYITCGFSAGGYVVCLWNTGKGYGNFGIDKPQACIPVYPVTSYRLLNEDEEEQLGEKEELARWSVGCSMAEACDSVFEIPLHVEGFPKTAIFVSEGDTLVNPLHSKNLAEALEKAGIPVRLEAKPDGWHGFADGGGMNMEGWPERAIKWIEE